VAWSWDPEPFGNTQPTGTFTYNHRFPGQYYDRETGLHHNGFRDYHPTTGRYIESDPVGLAAGLNTYAYVNSNPLRFIDPKGTIAPAAAIGACAASIVCSGAVAALAISAEEILRNALQGALQNTSQEEDSPTAQSPAPPANNPETPPPPPSDIVGKNPTPSSGQRINTDLPGVSFPDVVVNLTGGNTSDQGGHRVCPNGVRVRPGKPGHGPRIDIPANGPKPPETIHFPAGTSWPW
jgi:RHS repeat-associated protein